MTTYNFTMTLKPYGEGANLDGVYGTGWGYINAVTEYVDHWTRARTDENRFVAAQWGAGADLKQRAVKAINDLIAV